LCRKKEIVKNRDPIITWIPWNPVAKKKTDPKVESARPNEASQYSQPWSVVKYTPRKIVSCIALVVVVFFIWIKAWWAHVTVTPLASRTAVFNKGTWNGLIDKTPMGGHWLPNSKFGANLLWKKAQKKRCKKKNFWNNKQNYPPA